MLKGIKQVCSTVKNATSNHYYLVGCDGKSVWVEEEFVGNGCLVGLNEEFQWLYVTKPMTMKELDGCFNKDIF